jgi:hypothetical protein
MAWSKKYKKSIDCSNPKGFSQKAHCAGRKKRQSGETTKSKSVTEKNMKKIQKTNEGLFGATKKFSDAFFDGLKSNATNKALQKAKKNKSIPPRVVQKMSELDKAAKELEKMLKDLE